jgi:hypothetical protein
MGPLLPSAKSFPDELRVAPILCPSELHLWELRQRPEVDHWQGGSIAGPNWRKQAWLLKNSGFVPNGPKIVR